MPDELPIDEAKQLVALCAAGRLYAVEDWVRAGRSLQVPPQLKKTPLAVAMDTGFHSLIDLLLFSQSHGTRRHGVAVAGHRPVHVHSNLFECRRAGGAAA